MIEQAGEPVRWEILRKPKTELPYNLPVLVGFGGRNLDPIGASMAEAWDILRGTGSGDAWAKILDYWSAAVACPVGG